MIQDPAKFVRGMQARVTSGGLELPVERADKARWRIAPSPADSLEVRYEVYAHALLTDGIDLTRDHLFLNPVMCLPYVEGHLDDPYEVVLHVPPDWKFYTELPETAKAPPTYLAKNYDELVDSPIDCGHPVELSGRARGAPHRVVVCGAGGNYEPHRLVEDVSRIAESAMQLVGDDTPTPYTMFVHLSDVRDGGLEHRNSASCVVERTGFEPASSYRRMLTLLSHEYFHRYLVKQIRPRVLGPFDYTREVYTHLLWLMEGTTDYYGEVLLRRAGLWTTKQFLNAFLKRITEYRQIPGRHWRSLEEASFLTWIDQYHPFEDSPNVSVSYYLKGALVSLCLDLELRHRSENRKSLDDVLRLLWAEFGRPGRGLGEGDFGAVAERATGVDIGDFSRRFIAGTDEVDFEATFRYAGLQLKAQGPKSDDEDTEDPGFLGVRLSTEDGRVRIRSVLDGTPAQRAGLAAGDEIVALNGARVDSQHFDQWLKRYPPGTGVEVSFFSRGWLSTASLTLGHPPAPGHVALPVPDASPLERAVFESWLGEKWVPPKADGPSP